MEKNNLQNILHMTLQVDGWMVSWLVVVCTARKISDMRDANDSVVMSVERARTLTADSNEELCWLSSNMHPRTPS